MSLYLDLLKRSLTGMLIRDPSIYQLNTPITPGKTYPYDHILRETGADWPSQALTMVGLKRLENIEECMLDIWADEVDGDFLEAGVWRGGASIFMAGFLAETADDEDDARVFVCDSFQGLPHSPLGLDTLTELSVPQETVEDNFERYNLLSSRVVFVPGWFKDTLPNLQVEKLALLRCDGDLYESTKDTLEPLYPKLVSGGFCIIDDYSIPECRQAVTEYREEHNIIDPIRQVDWTCVYWRKS